MSRRASSGATLNHKKTHLHLRDRIREATVSEKRRFQPVWFWSRATLLGATLDEREDLRFLH